jgi:single-strand DNA-binding protein
MNIIQIAGHLGADPVTRFTATGQKVTSFNVAVNVRKSGKDETIWFKVTCWGDKFDKMLAYLKKGSAIIVYGELSKPELWTDKQGQTQISLEITADIIRFSPFGKPDRPGQEGSQNNQEQSYGESLPQNSFGANSQSPSAYRGPSQQGNQRPSPSPMVENEEETVPF